MPKRASDDDFAIHAVHHEASLNVCLIIRQERGFYFSDATLSLPRDTTALHEEETSKKPLLSYISNISRHR